MERLIVISSLVHALAEGEGEAHGLEHLEVETFYEA